MKLEVFWMSSVKMTRTRSMQLFYLKMIAILHGPSATPTSTWAMLFIGSDKPSTASIWLWRGAAGSSAAPKWGGTNATHSPPANNFHLLWSNSKQPSWPFQLLTQPLPPQWRHPQPAGIHSSESSPYLKITCKIKSSNYWCKHSQPRNTKPAKPLALSVSLSRNYVLPLSPSSNLANSWNHRRLSQQIIQHEHQRTWWYHSSHSPPFGGATPQLVSTQLQ